MPPPNQTAKITDVVKTYGTTRALDGLDLTLCQGEIVALLGPNGAGKTTALAVLTGSRRPDSGSVELLGGHPREVGIRRRIGLTPQESGFPNALRVGEILRLVRAHYPNALTDRVLFDRFPIRPLAGRQVGGLSGGQKRTLAVALAFVGAPELVFLDEPTTGLDVDARRALWAAIAAYRNDGGTVVLTTHYLEEAEALASRVVVVHKGRAVAEGSVDDIRRKVGQSRVRFEGDVPDDLPAVTRVERDAARATIYTNDADALVRALVAGGSPFSNLEVTPASLEEAFVSITAQARQ